MFLLLLVFGILFISPRKALWKHLMLYKWSFSIIIIIIINISKDADSSRACMEFHLNFIYSMWLHSVLLPRRKLICIQESDWTSTTCNLHSNPQVDERWPSILCTWMTERLRFTSKSPQRQPVALWGNRRKCCKGPYLANSLRSFWTSDTVCTKPWHIRHNIFCLNYSLQCCWSFVIFLPHHPRINVTTPRC